MMPSSAADRRETGRALSAPGELELRRLGQPLRLQRRTHHGAGGEAKANLDNLRATEDTLRQNVTLEVRQALLNLGQAAESIVVADKGLQQARENLMLAEGRYKTGVGNIIELTDAQVSLATAEASRVQALVGYRTALATLERSTAHRFVTD